MVLGNRPNQITLKTDAEIDEMRLPAAKVAETLQELAEMARPGIRLSALDQMVDRKFARENVTPTFKGYLGYPYTICASVNEQIVHGFPTDRTLEDGDILSLDLGATINGWVADSAVTIGIGSISREAQRLLDVTKESLAVGIDTARVGARKGDIGAAIQAVIESAGFGVVRNYVGHGVGHEMHEPPSMPNYGTSHTGLLLRKGLVIALEPMATIGDPSTTVLPDGWTVVTAHGGLAAHFEHTMAIRPDQPADVLTQWT